MSKSWQEKIKEYCSRYNIPLSYLTETLYEPKVIPMIRGKAFEFSVMLLLQKILPKNEWKVDKPILNAQAGSKDIDVRIYHKRTKKFVRVECKLAKKGGYRLFPDGHSEIRVKCMRSRTLGPSKVKELAPKLRVSEEALSTHNDQYIPEDFDIVISSIGNSFYQTNKDTGLFVWRPTKNEEKFLQTLGPINKVNMKGFSFHKMYAARSQDLAIRKTTGITCTRNKCRNKKNCGFIPNYPIIWFDQKTNKPTNAWTPIEKSLKLFRSFVNNR